MDKAQFLQTRFVGKENLGFQLPSYPFSLPAGSTAADFSQLLLKLAEAEGKNLDGIELDFLISNEFVRTSLGEIVVDRNIPLESVVEVECVLRQTSPHPEFSLPHNDWVAAVVSCDHFIATGCYDNSITLWNLRGNPLLTLPAAHSDAVKCLAIVDSQNVEDIRLISGSMDQTLTLWRYNSLTGSLSDSPRLSLRGHERSVECVGANTAGTRVASGGFDTFLKIWDVSDATEEPTLKRSRKSEDISVVPRVSHISCYVRWRCPCFYLSCCFQTPMVTLAGHREAIMGLVWTGPAEVATASVDHSVLLWDLELAGQKCSIVAKKSFLDISYSPLNGLFITASTDPIVRLWDARAKDAQLRGTFASHREWVSAVQWSSRNSNNFISASYDQMTKMWDIRSPKAPLYDLCGHEEKILCCDWSVDHMIISGGADASVKVYKTG